MADDILTVTGRVVDIPLPSMYTYTYGGSAHAKTNLSGVRGGKLLHAEGRHGCLPHLRNADTEGSEVMPGVRPSGLIYVRRPLESRFWAKVNKDGPIPQYRPDLGPCWLWTAALHNGYGSITSGGWHGRTMPAHAVAWQIENGPVPPGSEMDHLCRVRHCVRPSHIEPVTKTENLRRGFSPSAVNARKTHCDRGHEFTPENTVRRPHAPHKRRCRACDISGAKERKTQHGR